MTALTADQQQQRTYVAESVSVETVDQLIEALRSMGHFSEDLDITYVVEAVRELVPNGSHYYSVRIRKAERVCRKVRGTSLMSEQSLTTDKRATVHDDVIEALNQALEYFEDREDINDGDYGEPQPNEAMKLAGLMRDALEWVKP